MALGTELSITVKQAEKPSLVFRSPRFGEALEIRWEGGLNGHEDLLDVLESEANRSLTSLSSQSQDTSLRCVAVPLPTGGGLAVYLEGERPASVRLSVRESVSAFFALKPDRENYKSYRFRHSNPSIHLVIAADRGIETALEDSPTTCRFGLAQESAQIVFAFGETPAAARKTADTYLGKSRKKVEAAVREALQTSLAFSLNTSDDRMNRAFALLAANLGSASGFLEYETRADFERNAQLASAFFLASRQQPEFAFSETANPNRHFTRSQKFRFGWQAFRDGLRYGMANEAAVKQLADEVISELDLLQGELTLSRQALDNETIADSSLRLACSQIELAGMQTMGEEIVRARGDNAHGDVFRRLAMTASKSARKYFADYNSPFAAMRKTVALSELESVIEGLEPAKETDPKIILESSESYDSISYFRAGARTNFNWLSDNPERLAEISLMDGFGWQKWTAYRFNKDLRITQTPDLDSLLTMLLDGATPGALLTETAEGESAPDYSTMAATFQNLAELYLGFHPDWLRHRVEVFPRLPSSWGHTAARLPFGMGYIHLEYDFVHDRARIGISGYPHEIAFLFGYPLANGGSLTAQFRLSKDRPAVEIVFVRKQDNMTELRIDDVSN